MSLRQAIGGYIEAIGNFLLGRDFDVVAPPRPNDGPRGTARRRGMPIADIHRRPEGADPEGRRLADAVEDARRQWVAARQFFDHVTEPELIDYAVFSIGAAEKRYMFLLDEARRRGVKVNPLLHRL